MTAAPPPRTPSEGLPPGGDHVPGYSQPAPQPPWVLPKGAYTPWSRRLWASLIDWIPIVVFVAGPVVYLLVQRFTCDDFLYDVGLTTRSYEYYCTRNSVHVRIALMCCGLLLAAAYFLWNLCYRQGRTGQSIGKSMLKFRCVRDSTWEPIGFGRSLVRQAAHYLDYTFFFVGFLVPLWDQKRQTFADKIVGTVCVPGDQTPALPGTDSRPVASSGRSAVASWAVAGVVVLFVGACGAALISGSGAGSSISTTGRTGDIGEPVSDGNLQFVVVRFGRASLQSDPAGEFVVAGVVVTNTGSQPQPLTVGDQYVVDTAGRTYSAADMAVYPGPLQQPVTVLNLNSGSVKVVIRFEIPKQTRLIAVELHDAPSSAGVRIQLH
jgi:uncharacterized RDD family membrane protein YckC